MRNRPYENRIGRFRISQENIQAYPDRVRELLSQVVIVRAELRFDWDAIEYTAFGPCFDIVRPGCESRVYAVVMTFSTGHPKSPNNREIMCYQPWAFRKDDVLWTPWERQA